MIPYDPNSAILQFDGNRMDLVIEYRNNIRGPYSLALQQILDKMRTTPLKGRFVILIKKPFTEFQLAQLSGIRGSNPEIVKGVIYKSIAEAEHKARTDEEYTNVVKDFATATRELIRAKLNYNNLDRLASLRQTEVKRDLSLVHKQEG